MKNTKSVALPFLIYRDEKAIESEVSHLRQSREEVATALRGFIKKFCDWTQDRNDGIPGYLVDLIFDNEVENELLRTFLTKKSIDPAQFNLAKVKELYIVPDYSAVVSAGLSIATRYKKTNLLQYITDGADDVTAPEVTKGEKEAIIEKHSIYIHTEQTYNLYRAVGALCEYGNIFNFEINGFSALSPAKLMPAMPLGISKYLDFKKEMRGQMVVGTFLPKYEMFGGK